MSAIPGINNYSHTLETREKKKINYNISRKNKIGELNKGKIMPDSIRLKMSTSA
jgi:hypothetical protein